MNTGFGTGGLLAVLRVFLHGCGFGRRIWKNRDDWLDSCTGCDFALRARRCGGWRLRSNQGREVLR